MGQQLGDLRRAPAGLADDVQRGRTIDLVEPGRHLTHRDVPGVGGVAAIPLVVFAYVQQNRARAEFGGQVIDGCLRDWRFCVHGVDLVTRGRAALRPVSSYQRVSTVSTGLSTGRLDALARMQARHTAEAGGQLWITRVRYRFVIDSPIPHSANS